jgi:hypothetical protein
MTLRLGSMTRHGKYYVQTIIIVGAASGLLFGSPRVVATKKAPKRLFCVGS